MRIGSQSLAVFALRIDKYNVSNAQFQAVFPLELTLLNEVCFSEFPGVCKEVVAYIDECVYVRLDLDP